MFRRFRIILIFNQTFQKMLPNIDLTLEHFAFEIPDEKNVTMHPRVQVLDETVYKKRDLTFLHASQ